MTPPKLVDRLVLLTGHAGAGKDTVGALLRMRRYRRFAFGDLVKDEVQQFISAGRQLAPGYFAALEDAVRIYHIAICGSPWNKPMSPEMRRWLQWHGSEFRRAQDPDYWVKRLVERIDYAKKQLIVNTSGRSFRDAETVLIQNLPARLDVVITDARFANELALGSIAHHAEVWRVTNPRLDLSAAMYRHESENAWLGNEPDRLIDNRGTVYELAELVAGALDDDETTRGTS